MNLLDRIDLALKQAGKSRGQLAEAIELSTQAISNLKRRPGSTLRPENVAKAARWLKCDLYWLCTGEGPGYVPAQRGHGFLASEVADWMDSLPEVEQHRAFALIYQVFKEGHHVAASPAPTDIGHHARLSQSRQAP